MNERMNTKTVVLIMIGIAIGAWIYHCERSQLDATASQDCARLSRSDLRKGKRDKGGEKGPLRTKYTSRWRTKKEQAGQRLGVQVSALSILTSQRAALTLY